MKTIESSNNQAVILLSGGIDSAVSAYLYHKKDVNLHALTFVISDGYATSVSDLKCAKKIVSRLGLEHTIIDLSCLLPLIHGFFDNVSNHGNQQAIRGIKRKDRAIPFGVEMMLVAASMYAATHDIKRIVWSINRDDIGDKLNPSDISAFIEIFKNFIGFRNGDRSCKIETPLIAMRKTEVVSLGTKLNVPFNDTFSCLLARNEMVHCGECEQCIQRSKAFENLRKEDH